MSLVPVNIHLSLEPISKDEWIDDSQCNACYICTDIIKSSFIKSNKHHCRYCGSITCSSCSQNQLNRKRICDECIQHEISQQIKQQTTKDFIYASILQDKQIQCLAVFIRNQIIFYKLQNRKELKISAFKTIKISEIFDIEYIQFESVKRSESVSNGITTYHIELVPYYVYQVRSTKLERLTFIDEHKRDEWYNCLNVYISNLMEKERIRRWESARTKDQFKALSGRVLLQTQNKIKSVSGVRGKLGYVHGSYILDCNNTNKVIWQFKIDRLDDNDAESVIIGIDNQINADRMLLRDLKLFKPRSSAAGFSMIKSDVWELFGDNNMYSDLKEFALKQCKPRLKTFALCNNGRRWINDESDNGGNYGKTFKAGDIVTMVYRKPYLAFYGNEYCIDADEVSRVLSFWIRREHVIKYPNSLDSLIFQFYFYRPLLTQFRLNLEENQGIKYRLSVYLQFHAEITLNFFHQCEANF